MNKTILLITTMILCISLLCRPVCSQDSTLLRAMQDELKRSMDSLKLEHEAGPYFMSYLVRDAYLCIISADSGAITKDQNSRGRTLYVTAKVGDYTLDNTHFEPAQTFYYASSGASLTTDDDYNVLRRQLWLETDNTYKNALETLTKKKAWLEHKIRKEALPDFTRGEAFSQEKPPIPLSMEKRDEMEKLVKHLSKLLLQNDKIQKSSIRFGMRGENVYYINSEGVRSVEPHQVGRLVITASTQASDGMPLKNFRIYSFRNPGELPGEEQLGKDTGEMIQELMALRAAPVVEDYSGPVFFEKQAAAEMLARGFVNVLAANRISESDNPETETKAKKLGNPFLRKAGAKIIGGSISVKARPGQSEYKGAALLGSYGVDEEGTKTQEVSIVEGGFLKSFMMSRSPLKGFSHSNGHFRGSATCPSVVEVTSAKASSTGELRRRLISAVKEEGLKYGYLVKTILPPEVARDPDENLYNVYSSQESTGLSEFELSKPVLVYRVYADGRPDELVRGADLGKMSVKIFRYISGASDDRFVYNYPISIADPLNDSPLFEWEGRGSGYYASLIAPSILLSEVDINASSGSYRQLPIVSFPLQGK